MELRDYQTHILDQVKAHMRAGERRLLIVSPTGSGKTVLVAHMLKSAARKGNKSWFAVHRRELIMQSIRTFHQVGVKHGVISTNFPENRNNPIQLVSVQTIARRIGKYDSPNIIILDEGHHAAAGTWRKLFDNYPRAFFVLLTATPERLDGKGLKEYANVMINGPSVSQLISDGYLSDYKAYAPPSQIDTAGLKKSMGDFQKSALGKRAIVTTGDAVKEYKSRACGKKAIAFCANIEHSKHVVNAFNSAGISAAHVDGTTDAKERDRKIKLFKEGKINVLSNVELFGEGFDVPSIEAVILLRPTQSLSLHLQQVGRALRPADGKSHAIIIDHAGNLERHGLPDQPRLWSLLGKKERLKNEKETITRVRTCPTCFATQLASSFICRFCGSDVKTQKEIEIIEKEQELQELELTKMREKWEVRRERSQINSYEDAVEFGKRRGYKPTWAKFYWSKCRKNKC